MRSKGDEELEEHRQGLRLPIKSIKNINSDEEYKLFLFIKTGENN